MTLSVIENGVGWLVVLVPTRPRDAAPARWLTLAMHSGVYAAQLNFASMSLLGILKRQKKPLLPDSKVVHGGEQVAVEEREAEEAKRVNCKDDRATERTEKQDRPDVHRATLHKRRETVHNELNTPGDTV